MAGASSRRVPQVIAPNVMKFRRYSIGDTDNSSLRNIPRNINKGRFSVPEGSSDTAAKEEKESLLDASPPTASLNIVN